MSANLEHSAVAIGLKKVSFHSNPKEGQCQRMSKLSYNCTHFTCERSESESCWVVSDSLRPQGLFSPWNSPGQNTGVGSLSLLQGVFPTQGPNPGLLQCRWILYQLSHKGSLRILECVAYPFSSGSSRPRNQTRVSCIAGGFFTNWAIREALIPDHILNQYK